MAEFEIIKEQVERKTYLKGRFKGKFIGYLDTKQLDRTNENFYDLEVLSGEVLVKKSDLRTWTEGDEFDEFINVEKFLTNLPNPLNCEVYYEDGKIKHFKIHLHESKLQKFTLSQRLYEGNKVFATIEGEISGYLKHFDIIEKKIEIIPTPKPTLSKKNTETINEPIKKLSNSNFGKKKKLSDLIAEGCAYLFLAIILLIFTVGIIAFFVNASILTATFIFICGLVLSILLKSREIIISLIFLFLLFLLVKFLVALLFAWQLLLLLLIIAVLLYFSFPINRSFYSIIKWLFSIIVFILLPMFLF